jgi:hypothetical protein
MEGEDSTMIYGKNCHNVPQYDNRKKNAETQERLQYVKCKAEVTKYNV